MPALQLPRLTTTLRVFFDVDNEYIRRKQILESKRARRIAVLNGSSIGESDLARKIVPGWDSAPSYIRLKYELFLKAVAELVDGEVSTEELQQSASIVYDALHDFEKGETLQNPKALISQKREELAAVFGQIFSDSSLVKAAELAHELYLWRSKSSLLGLVTTDVSSSGRKETAEFGANLDFRVPSVEAETDDHGWGILTTSQFEKPNEWQEMSELAHVSEERTNQQEDVGEYGVAGQERRAQDDQGGADLRWYKRMCYKAAEAGAGAQFSGDELALAVARVLESDRSGDEIAGDLFDLIGDAWFDFIQELLQHRKELVDLIQKGLTALRSEKAPAVQARMPSYGTQVSVQTGSDRQIDKLRRKEEKRQARRGFAAGGEGDSDLEWLAGVGGFAALIDSGERNVGAINSLIGKGEDVYGISGTALPTGSVRKSFKGYEEVKVPATPGATIKPDERLVPISELDDFAQLAFEGIKTLNRIQSRIFPTAYNSNENLLVCAPTGAGKTNIAMIAVLHEIGQHFKYGVLQKSEFKVVYVAPMKALAAEMTSAFGRRLQPLGVVVKELTGDMQLTKRELEETQMIVTTPEKWDVITRKTSDMALAVLVKLLIIDEVHLLNDDRGPVIETLVARTLRQVETSQSMIRIVGLSATLPNYLEVAQFLHVNPDSGLFYFDASYRPVPLSQQYIGVTEPRFTARNTLMNEICYNKVLDAIKRDQQAMVFVHSRKDTVKTARILVELAQKNGHLGFFTNVEHPQYGLMKKEMSKSRNRELAELFQSCFGVHHAGMLRSDRNFVERAFHDGLLKVLVCTATLAWGVNLPAHMVVIKGTQLYDPKAGGFRELGMLDVMQIFGRAGRPQFDTSGEGIIITTHDKLSHYLRLMTHQLPIESQFISSLKDNLNAEVVLGSVTNVREACIWLGYTYLFVRMSSNPLVYGMTWEEVLMDPQLNAKRKSLITDAARSLDKAKMLRFDEKSGNLYAVDLGRVASHFYIQYRSVETYNDMLKRHMNDSEVIHLLAHSSEFENIVVREEEQQELANLVNSSCPLEVRGGPDDKYGKINILIQVYISRGYLEGFSLIADSAYINASLGRIMRALFEICIRRGWCSMAALLLEYCKAVDRRVWPHQHPLRQFDAILSQEILHKLEDRGAEMDRLYDMDEKEIGALIRHPYGGKVALTISPEFLWKDRVHGASESWHIWVEDSENEHIYHSELFVLTKKMMAEGSHTISFTIPIFEPLPSQYYIRAVSDTWMQASTVHTVSFKHLILPELHPPHTELLDLRPLPVTALGNKVYESLYSRFSHFNPIQTQAFHTLYHTDFNVLLGAPTGSGKTISSELAMLHLFNTQPDMKVIYIAPLKALVKERMDDWKRGLATTLGKKIVELTGDFTPDLLALLAADIIISTPEKWDGISRNWHNRNYVTKVGLIIIDEIHLLGADRGPILEVIVSRMRYISSQTELPVRFVGLSTALANARDLADWLGIDTVGLFNFKPSVRPVPLEVHIQTRLTALDLIQYATADERPRQFSNLSEDEMEMILSQVVDTNLKHTLQFGIGLHHAGLNERDRTLVEELFTNVKIQVLVCTSTLAWGVNLPAHLVVIKGTEFFDGKQKRYVDFPITDVLQMMGRAGRPQYDQHGKAIILVHEPKKSFYKKFLYEPFPVESSLAQHLHNHFNAEVVSGTIASKQDAVDYLTWTYLFRRLVMNPSYYNLEDTSSETINSYLSRNDNVQVVLVSHTQRLGFSMVTTTLQALEDSGCIRVNEDNTVEPLMLGMIASQYYLNYTTVALFSSNLKIDTSPETLLHVLSGAAEYDELPVLHNEENFNEGLAEHVRYAVDNRLLDDPHVKTNLLLQAHFTRLELPISDYITDTKSVLDQSIRILQAMVDVSANSGWLQTSLNTMHLLQMVMQVGTTKGLWDDVSPLLMLPHVDEVVMKTLAQRGITTLPKLLSSSADFIRKTLSSVLSQSELTKLVLGETGLAVTLLSSFASIVVWSRLPRVDVKWRVVRRPGPSESSLQVEVRLVRRTQSAGSSARAYVPRFPKVKEEGWWLILGSPQSSELHALKRISFVDHLTTNLTIPLASQEIYLFLVSDCYLGFDQQFQLGNIVNSTSNDA
ncbi:hypothetical protein AXG93_3893s1430 [Marchantia polymorpha subsp. ruderalis]|uniref:Activating signal cointegrator 1 complex subunit 3 n=1 Tax=Marchantia polymorpha subsp. ruderalis TaxID=1480154 RepID=A0A176WBF2_MARPO|nr:hypothetical protein AXG93_3893s1430 [Marchantia polymorpha subsp. ruderalis]